MPAGHWSASVLPISRWRDLPIRMEPSLPGIVRQLPLCISQRQMLELSYRKYCCVYIGFGYEQSAILYARRAVIVVACMFVIIRVVAVTVFHNRT